MGVIERVSVDADRLQEMWGVSAYDYKLNNARVDLQDLLVQITQQRATAIEAEVKPLESIINRRNANLEKFGAVLQLLTTMQAKYDEDTKSVDGNIGSIVKTVGSYAEFWKLMSQIGHDSGSGDMSGKTTITLTKAACEGLVSRCKSKIDEMNNDAQKDMTRLQSVVDRRDESYSTATSLMTSVSDTRSALIKSI